MDRALLDYSTFKKQNSLTNLLTYITQKQSGYYYFVKREKDKIVSFSLKTKNLVEAIIKRDTELEKMKLTANIEQVKSGEEQIAKDFETELALLCKKYKIKDFKLKTPIDTDKTIKDTYAQFINYKKTATKVKQATLDLYGTAYKYLLQFTNENEKINILTADFFQDIEETLALVPANMHKFAEFKNLPIKKIIKLNQSKQTPLKTLSNKTINNLMLVYKIYLDYIVKQRKYLPANPLNERAMLPEEENHYPEFTNEELIILFGYLEYKNMDETFDILKLLLFTGMRISELANLKKENVFKINHNYFLDIIDSKTKNGIRQIAVQRGLNGMNCFQELNNKPQDYIFMKDAKTTDRSNYFSKKLLAVIKSVPTNEFDNETKRYKPIKKVLHSFRSNFIQMLYQLKDLDEVVIKILVGHSTKNNITYTIYNKNKVFYDKLANTVDSIGFYQTFEDAHKRCLFIRSQEMKALDAKKRAIMIKNKFKSDFII